MEGCERMKITLRVERRKKKIQKEEENGFNLYKKS
jgi:hypothetical protein